MSWNPINMKKTMQHPQKTNLLNPKIGALGSMFQLSFSNGPMVVFSGAKCEFSGGNLNCHEHSPISFMSPFGENFPFHVKLGDFHQFPPEQSHHETLARLLPEIQTHRCAVMFHSLRQRDTPGVEKKRPGCLVFIHLA